MSNSELKKALELIQQGEKSQARMILNGVLRQNPKNVNAWLLVTAVARNDDEKRKAAKNVLKLQPGHPKAQKILRGLQQQDTATRTTTVEEPPQKPSQTVGDLMSEPKRKSKPALSGVHSFDDDDEIFDFDKPSSDDNVFNFDAPNEYDALFGSEKSFAPPRKTSAHSKKTSSNTLVFVGLGFVAVLAIGIILAGVAMMSQGGSGSGSGNTIRETVSVGSNDSEYVDINVSGFYQITARGVGDFDPVIDVFEDGWAVASNDDHDNVRGLDTFDAFIAVVPLNDDSRIEIYDYWDEGGRANVIIEPYSGRIDSIGIDDSVTFEVGTGQVLRLNVGSEQELTITASSVGGYVDTVLAIYDEDFELIERNDDHNTDIDGLDYLDSAIEDIDLSGTVYLFITDYYGTSTDDVTVRVRD